MKSYLELSALSRNGICFWAILLLLGFCMSAVYAVRLKRYLNAAVAVIALLVSYLLMQICRNISCACMGGTLHPLAEALGKVPYLIYLLLLVSFTAVLAAHFQFNVAYSRKHITPTAIKEAVDQNPTGICYYRENGQVVLTNYKMNELAFSITGQGLLNGREFYEAVEKNPVMELEDGTVVRFSHRTMPFEGEICHELIADDITELYRKSETLREENECLKDQNQRMKEYGETIDENVRRQEVLNTKTKIHDEMNRLLLSTDNVVRGGTEAEKQSILETWQKNILLLCMEAGNNTRNNALSDLEALSKVIGVEIVFEKQPETKDKGCLLLFSLAAEEAMTNAAKHDGAKHLYVNLQEDARMLTATFTNDGNAPVEPVIEGGGLSNLRRHLEQAGGQMKITTEQHFALTVFIPKGEKENVL